MKVGTLVEDIEGLGYLAQGANFMDIEAAEKLGLGIVIRRASGARHGADSDWESVFVLFLKSNMRIECSLNELKVISKP